MPTSMLQYEMLPTTWFYVSTLIILAVFFKFNRVWSVRNLDLIGIILLTPGLIILAMDDGQWGYVWLFVIEFLLLVRLFFDTVMVRRPLLEPNLTPGGLTFSCFFLVLFIVAALTVNRGSKIDTIRTVRLEHVLTTRHIDQKIGMNPASLTIPSNELPNLQPGFRPFLAFSELTNILFVPPPKIRAEMLQNKTAANDLNLTPNLNNLNLNHVAIPNNPTINSQFAAANLQQNIVTNNQPNEILLNAAKTAENPAVTKTLPAPVMLSELTAQTALTANPTLTITPTTPQTNSTTAPNSNSNSNSNSSSTSTSAPPTSPPPLTAPVTSSPLPPKPTLISDPEPNLSVTESSVTQIIPTPNLGQFCLIMTLSVSVQLLIVLAFIYIGHCHFGNIRTGVACATLYLLLPYTNQMVGRFDHIVPAALVVWAIAIYRRPFCAGILIGSAAALVFYPICLVPLWGSFYWRKGWIRFLIGTGLAVLVFAILLLLSPVSLGSYSDQLIHMFGKSSLRIFSRADGFWNYHDIIYRVPVLACFFAVCFGMLLWPLHKHLATLLSCSTIIMVGTQFWQLHQGGLYIAWFIPLLILTVFRPNLEDRIAQTTVV
ncbi:MAG: DUF2029 domain-containing protein [Planctomycetaceae bacterium]|jgi:hypothetical protein|nr:DUF2029 domain-containing protein [Planctomycetaceae bacterium]